jgi:hypothetical protein
LKANGGGNPRPPALISREPGSGRHKRAPTIQARAPVHSAAVTAT